MDDLPHAVIGNVGLFLARNAEHGGAAFRVFDKKLQGFEAVRYGRRFFSFRRIGVLEQVEFIFKMVHGNDVAVNAVLDIRDIVFRRFFLEGDVFKVLNGIVGNVPEEPVGNKALVQVVMLKAA
ncbi:hypothetical protein D9M70_573730 [compost metagenome]